MSIIVVVAAIGGFALGAWWQIASRPASVSPPTPPAPPTPVIVMAERFELPAANYSPEFAAQGWGFWDPGFADQPLTLVYAAPFRIDACMYDWPGGTPMRMDNFTDCSSRGGAPVELNQSSGTLQITVASQQDSGFAFYALAHVEITGLVNFTWWINSTAGATLMPPTRSVLQLQLGQLVSPYILNVSVPLPAGYTNVTVHMTSSSPVSGVFLLKPFNGSALPATSWNWTGRYQGPETMVATISTSSARSVTVTLAVAVFDS